MHINSGGDFFGTSFKPFLRKKWQTYSKHTQVSFWGNVAVEEHYDLRHTGAELKGFFSRLEFQKAQGQAPSAIKMIKADILPGATDMYYRDVIGRWLLLGSVLGFFSRGLRLFLLILFLWLVIFSDCHASKATPNPAPPIHCFRHFAKDGLSNAGCPFLTFVDLSMLLSF